MNGLRFGRRAVTLEAAQAMIIEQARVLETEEAELTEAYGRRLACPVAAASPVPHFRRSGVDGYAVRAEDTAGAAGDRPLRLQVTETIPAGAVPQQRVEAGQAARIMTGAVVPEGADTVIMLEMTDAMEGARACGTVALHRAMKRGENITEIGEETAPGEPLLETGRVIGPGEAAILATFGWSRVPVFRRPNVAVFSTGSELLPVEAELEPGRIRCSNSYMLACQVQEAGGTARIMSILPDDAAQVEAELLKAIEWADVVVTTGGVSVGDKDVLVELFERWDGELWFNKIAMRPGSPTSAGRWRGKPLFALSGNPGACYVGFELLVRPYLRAVMGAASPLPAESTAQLGCTYGKGSAYPRYVRGTTYVEDGLLQAVPAGHDKSSIMVSIKDADCLIHLPAGGRGTEKGTQVRILHIGRGTG
ncbi:molybdopterin molybdenumtransferase MoeA [Paenibacillus mucilaginosus]|uniref:molybdopterin molybdotransferase MoeA n=2 Tax=Paenibacillus mucilaginosus TaxID=61624 RepID=UPI00240E01DA|nr:gephyrin-like molybdotransferase Glp [Paenibacillus mucilaginosus]WFA16746.1 molybdopterin molybdenumtransferase MoeA [Paenibacillus mucilaginosus]